ncbi:hypothetical protein [Methanocella sp. MCL-LM]|uniref:hypothetical protein n=1 Tax=Methanocella sp. MCL-LM TaxID=3412035 RepID=UPI003C72B1BC
MKRYLIPLLMALLILTASVPGYCYTNTVAKKTNVNASEYESLTQAGMSTGAKIGLGTGAVLGAGVTAGVGTYVVIQVTSASLASWHAAMTPVALGTIERIYLSSMGEYVIAPAIGVGGAASGASVASVAAPIIVAAGVATVVMVVTATGIFIIWSAS